MHLNLPEVLERTKDYLLKLQCVEEDDRIQVDSTTLGSMGEVAAEVRKELNGEHHCSSPQFVRWCVQQPADTSFCWQTWRGK